MGQSPLAMMVSLSTQASLWWDSYLRVLGSLRIAAINVGYLDILPSDWVSDCPMVLTASLRGFLMIGYLASPAVLFGE